MEVIDEEGVGNITRGTTPTIEIEVDIDLTDYTCVLSIGKYGKPYVTVDNSQMTMAVSDGASTCAFKLTQAQSLACKKGSAIFQMRAVKDADAIVTEPIDVEIIDVIDQRVIEDIYDTER